MGFIKKMLEFYFKCYGYYCLSPVSADKNKIEKFLTANRQFVKKILTENDLVYFEKKQFTPEYMSIISSRLLPGSGFTGFAYIDTLKDEMAYCCWLNRSHNYYVKEINKRKYFGKNLALFEDDQTFASYNKLGLHTSMMTERLLYCIDNNVKEIFIAIQCNNIPALKTIMKFGFRRINLIPIYYRHGTVSYTLNKFRKLFAR